MIVVYFIIVAAIQTNYYTNIFKKKFKFLMVCKILIPLEYVAPVVVDILI